MTTTSAAFEFSTDGGATWKPSDTPLTGANALAASGSPIVLKARLTSLAGVHTVVWSVTTADDQTIEAGPLPTPVQASDKSATLTIPGAGGRSYVLEALVNPDRPQRRRLAVHVKTAAGYEVLAAGEIDEASRAYGWTKALNDAIRGVSAGGGGGASPHPSAPPAVAAAGSAGTVAEYSRGDHTHAGVTSVNGSQGAVVLAVPTAGGAPPAVASAGAAGAAATFSRSDHTHQGVTSVNGSQGAVVLAIPAAGAAPPAIAAAGAAGSTGTYSDAGHTHAGVTSVNGQQGAVTVTVPAAGGAPPAVAASGSAGSGTAYSLANHTHQGVTSVNGVSGAVNGTFAPTPGGAADRDKAVVGNSVGTGLILSSTVWLAAARFASAGSSANDVFGTASVQSTGDATNGQALGLRADPTLDKALLSFFDDANAQKGDLELDAANNRMTLRARAIGFRVTTSADDSTVPILCEASNANVGLAGASVFGGMVGGVSVGPGATAPTSVSGTTVALFNSGGIWRQYATGGHGLFVSTAERFRVFSSEVCVAATNFSIGQVSGSYGGGSGVVFLKNATTVPASNSTGGGILYSEAGALKWRSPAGNITQLAPN